MLRDRLLTSADGSLVTIKCSKLYQLHGKGRRLPHSARRARTAEQIYAIHKVYYSPENILNRRRQKEREKAIKEYERLKEEAERIANYVPGPVQMTIAEQRRLASKKDRVLDAKDKDKLFYTLFSLITIITFLMMIHRAP